MSIPLVEQNGKSKALKDAGKTLLLSQEAGEEGQLAPGQSSATSDERESRGERRAPSLSHEEVALWDPKHRLRPYYEALRDRLITFFEVKGLTHKPKLVAVTSCAAGSGVSTIAAGMAASLSETGDGNVLLVEMNLQNGAAHQFYRGSPACGLDEALELEKRSSALVQDNLYVVRESAKSDKLPRVLPKRFTHLVPKLKASDYDYIIFDLPPISQTSATPRLARAMDMVLMVVESEKTNCDLVKSASALIAESDASVGVVLNKWRSYVPRQLRQEL
jgi:Mrp family chromosome partitioning ATPase